MKSKQRKFAVVEWFDHCSFADSKWRQTEDAMKSLLHCISCGWIADENEDTITLHLTQSDNGCFSGDITIGKGLVKKIKRFNYG